MFLDRDGTINADVGYLGDPAGLVMLPGAIAGIQAFNRAGWRVIVISNQSGVGRGYFDEAALAAIHDRLIAELAEAGAQLDGIYYCPHQPDAGCECRKPALGLLLQAQREHGIDLGRSWVIGDRPSDIELGRRAGCRTALVLPEAAGPGKGAGAGNARIEGMVAGAISIVPDCIIPDLAAAAAAILGPIGE